MTRRERNLKNKEAERRFGFLILMSPFVIALAAIAIQIGQNYVSH